MKKSSRAHRSAAAKALKRGLLVLLGVLGCVAILVGFWFLSQLGPKEVGHQALQAPAEITPELLALREQSLQSEAQFDQILVMRPPKAEDFVLLQRALQQQAAYVDALPHHDPEAVRRHKNLDQRYQDLQGQRLRRASDRLEREAQQLQRSKEYDAAREKFKQAYELQESINSDFSLSSARDVGRATRLRRKARVLIAEPLLKRSLEFERQAELKVAAQDWGQAAALLEQAIALQDQLNRDYRASTQASVARFERLKVKLMGIQSGADQREIEKVSGLADVRLADGEMLEAANLYQEAARLQQRLNETYPESPDAASERVADFKRKAETAQSFELGVEIENNYEWLTKLLSERRTYEAAEVIVALRRDLKQMQQLYPRSSLNSEELHVKIRYLNLVQNDLGFIQDRIYDALLPLPTVAGFRMLRTEVPQALYSLVMGRNPSRNQVQVAPVDSVSWLEAKEFCERLGWIMGRSVRLPTENEFRQALGPLRYVVLEEHVWSSANSNGVAQPIATKAAFSSGFYDLLGNVSEWLESVDRFAGEDVRHIGGHMQDSLEVMFAVPMRSAPRGERSRMIGFRVVMAID